MVNAIIGSISLFIVVMLLIKDNYDHYNKDQEG
jgi:hypothetical protein